VIEVLIKAERRKHSGSYGFVVLAMSCAARTVLKVEGIILPPL